MRSITLALCLVALVIGQEANGPEVDTTYGKIKGAMGQSRGGRMYYSFKGVPYGKIVERFQLATTPDKWEGAKDGTQKGNECIQYNPFSKEIKGEEDCLNLDVYTPRMPKEGEDKILLPVVVYLHPGLNSLGSNHNYGAKYFMDEDVILVVPNFRLHLFGFLNVGNMYAQGNMGLHDQALALKFVQENIEFFGGDKSRVTLIGSGSGAADAFIHTLSPKSKGLIHNVIAMGGSTLSRTTVILDPIKQAKKLGSQVGCPIDSSTALVMCLKSKDAKEIIEKTIKINPQEFNNEEVAWFGPSVEKMLDGQTESDLILSDNPVKLVKEGKIVNKVPLTIGANDHGGIQLLSEDFLRENVLLDKLDKQWDDLAPELFIYKDSANDKQVVSSKIREFYFGDKPISNETFEQLSNIFLDRFTGMGLIFEAMYYSKAAPVYMYLFNHKPENTKLKYLGITGKNFGMAHLDDLQYLFDFHLKPFDFPEITKESPEYELSHGLVKVLSSFAENGKPTKIWGEAKEWKKIDAGEPGKSKWFIFGKTTAHSVLPEVFTKRIDLWVDLFHKELGKELQTPAEEKF